MTSINMYTSVVHPTDAPKAQQICLEVKVIIFMCPVGHGMVTSVLICCGCIPFRAGTQQKLL